MKTHYTILGVHRGSEPEEIRATYLGLAKLYHPDRTNNDPALNSMMVDVNLAYAVIGDKNAKKKYDKNLDIFNVACTYCKGRGYTKKQRGALTDKFLCVVCAGSGVVPK